MLREREQMSEVEWMDIFAANLQSLMDEERMSQNELARKTGISQGTISRYLNRQCMPSVPALVNIAHVFRGVEITDLLYFYKPMEMRPSRRW